MSAFNGILTHAWTSLHASLDLLWSKVSPVLLPLLLILIFLAVGLWIAGFVSEKLAAVIKKSKIDALLDRILAPTLKLAGTKVSSSSIVSGAVKWFFIATVVIAALDLADLPQVIGFFNQAIAYLPNIFAATLIIVVGSLLGNLAATVVKFIAGNGNSHLVNTAKATVNVLAFIAALNQLVTPIVVSFNEFIGHLGLSHLQADVLFIGVAVLVLLGSKSALIKTVEGLLKH